jgi:hypothetical protein
MYSIAISEHCVPAMYRVSIHSPEWGDKVDYGIGLSTLSPVSDHEFGYCTSNLRKSFKGCPTR